MRERERGREIKSKSDGPQSATPRPSVSGIGNGRCRPRQMGRCAVPAETATVATSFHPRPSGPPSTCPSLLFASTSFLSTPQHLQRPCADIGATRQYPYPGTGISIGHTLLCLINLQYAPVSQQQQRREAAARVQQAGTAGDGIR